MHSLQWACLKHGFPFQTHRAFMDEKKCQHTIQAQLCAENKILLHTIMTGLCGPSWTSSTAVMHWAEDPLDLWRHRCDPDKATISTLWCLWCRTLACLILEEVSKQDSTPRIWSLKSSLIQMIKPRARRRMPGKLRAGNTAGNHRLKVYQDVLVSLLANGRLWGLAQGVLNKWNGQ